MYSKDKKISKPILFALDVGNTSITMGLFRGSKLAAHGRMPTHGHGSREAQLYCRTLTRFLKKKAPGSEPVMDVILSSVVPRATQVLKKVFRRLIGGNILVIGETVQAPVRNRTRIPSQVGQDRLVNAAAAYHLYGGPAIIVDFGTAVTLDMVSARREYLGGLIIPGMEVALEALVTRAALLPPIPMKPPREFLGRDTRSSMASGLFYGYGALCDGLVAGLKKRYAPRAKVIATGGHARLVAPFCRSIQVVNLFLTLEGLELAYRTKKNS